MGVDLIGKLFRPATRPARASSDTVETGSQAALGTFAAGFNCAQAILAAYGPRHGLDRDNALRLGGPFGSGMATGETCGAVTGALMVLGLQHAKTSAASLLSRDQTERLTLTFLERFTARNGTVRCKDLIGCDLRTPEGRRAARRDRTFKRQCPKFVKDAAEILESLEQEG